MTLDPDLLERVKRTAAELAEAERQALVAKAEYHVAIRRLHLAGGSQREIADALSLSHQRVQQIISATGGSWWRRAWASRNDVFICDRCLGQVERTLADPGGASAGLKRAPRSGRERCSFCRRRSDDARAVVTGPGANICSECTRISREFMSGHAA
jgi:hypothetical protein